MKYSIVIPSYNHLEDCLKPCIESILKNTDLEETEIVVVLNGSTDQSEQYLRSLGNPNIKFFSYPEPLGYAKSVNLGIKASNSDYVVLLNNDCIILDHCKKNEWLKMLEEPFKDIQVGITGVKRLWCPNVEEFFLIFFCVMIPSTLFNVVGFLDDSFWSGAEDCDWCLRAKRLSYKLVQVPNDKIDLNVSPQYFPIYHKAEATLNEYPGWQEIFDRNSNILKQRKQNGYYS